MAIYDVKYNPSLTPIAGATQMGTLAVAIGSVDYTTGGWYGGVDDDLGYVIYSDTSSTNLAGRPAGSASSVAQAFKPTFFRSKGKTDAALLELINRIPGNTQSFNNINDAKAWINNVEHFGLMVTGGGTGATGAGWYFYSDEGNLNTDPPTADGNAIFRINGSPAVETYNPNKANGVNSIYFNLSDSAGVDYTTQFTTLQNSGGTITMTQGANIATYTSVIPGTFFVDSMNGIFVIQTDPATQTVTSASPFVYASPISISFS
jgi:hypothetical protein